MELIDGVSSTDLAGIYKEIADIVGVDEAFKLYQFFGGQQVALPTRFYNNAFIKKKVEEEFNGYNVGLLCRRLGYSESSIRLMLREIRQASKEEK